MKKLKKILPKEIISRYEALRFAEIWACYRALSKEKRDLADKNFELLKANSKHPSLHFKQIRNLWSVRVGKHFRALGLNKKEGVVWFWIGSHADYDKLIS